MKKLNESIWKKRVEIADGCDPWSRQGSSSYCRVATTAGASLWRSPLEWL